MMADSQTVDIVPLIPAISAGGFVSVSLYVDDKGTAKELPTNVRATGLISGKELGEKSEMMMTGTEEISRASRAMLQIQEDFRGFWGDCKRVLGQCVCRLLRQRVS